MTRAEIEERVVAIIHDQKTLPADSLSRDTPLADVGIDSLDALSILFAIEETFGITVPDDQARSIKTMDDMIGVVEGLLPG